MDTKGEEGRQDIRTSEYQGKKREDRRQETEDRKHKTEKQKTEDRILDARYEICFTHDDIRGKRADDF